LRAKRVFLLPRAFDFPAACHVVLRIYNVLGQEVLTALDQDYRPGYQHYLWTGVNNAGQPLASGVYFYRLQAGTFTDVKKMVLLR
jgi:flagellar hook assembly protein FlgD